jgi:hypothetical protein
MTTWKVAAAVAAVLVTSTGAPSVAVAESKRLTLAPLAPDSAWLLTSLKQQFGSQLVAVGRVDRVIDAQSFVLLGTTVEAMAITAVAEGDYVAVLGHPAVAGLLPAERIVVLGAEYVPGASRVLLKAVIDRVESGTASATFGGLRVDYAASLSSSYQDVFVGGSAVEVSGIQPAVSGVMLADEVSEVTFGAGPYESLGTGRTQGSLGTGRTQGSLGTGRTQGSLGTGRTQGSLGTGRTQGSLGTGRTQGSLGTGRSDGSPGTGL